MLRSSTLFFLVSALAFSGCTATSNLGSSSRLRYGDDAQQNYEGALLAFRRGNCLDAEPVFRRIRREFPYSRFAALSELRVADCKFEAGEYPEAISAYRRFVRFRPSHSQVSYARFRIAESHFEQIPEDWLLAPPSFERDQGPTREALRQLRRFILDFPEDDRVAEANQMVERSLRLLAQHELYVARFYLRQDAYPATVGRLRLLLTSFEGSGVEAEALLLLGRTYLRMGDRRLARQTFQQLVQRYSDSEQASSAQSHLADLGPAPAVRAPEAEPAATDPA